MAHWSAECTPRGGDANWHQNLSLDRRSLYLNFLISDFNSEETSFLLSLSRTLVPCMYMRVKMYPSLLFMLAGKTYFYINNFWYFYPTGWTGFDRQDEPQLWWLRDKRRVEHKLTSELSTHVKIYLPSKLKKIKPQDIILYHRYASIF